MLHTGLGLLLGESISPYATPVACCNASNLESISDLHNAELNETMGRA